MRRAFVAFVGAFVVGGTPAAVAQSSHAEAGARRPRPHAALSAAEKIRRRPDFIDATAIAAAGDDLARYHTAGRTLGTALDEQTTYLLVRRTTKSDLEVHARRDDIVMIRSGAGAIVVGDSLVDSRYRAPGERIGGRLVGRRVVVVHAGDIMRIPAAVPHEFVVSGATPLEYLVIKVRRQELPIRWTSVSVSPPVGRMERSPERDGEPISAGQQDVENARPAPTSLRKRQQWRQTREENEP